MTFAEKLKRIRVFRGMTQRELGAQMGFMGDPQTRIAQYEMGYRLPKKDIILHLSEVLNVCPCTFDTEGQNKLVEFMEVLLWADEDLDGVMHLTTSEPLQENSDPVQGMEIRYITDEKWRNRYPAMLWFDDDKINNCLKEWAVMKSDLESGRITQEEYFEWKIRWPVSSMYYIEFKAQQT